MINDEREYRITRARAAEFEHALKASRGVTASALPPAIRQAQQEAIQSQLSELRADLRAYEALRRGRKTSMRVHSLDDLPRIFVQARIAGGLTQKDLATRLGLRQQQIQRYESTAYATASLSRVEEVAKVLGIRSGEPYRSSACRDWRSGRVPVEAPGTKRMAS
jgi:ribosome-binding protein aMBF1 (putative translation factor)